MESIILLVHLIIALAMIGVVLLQRSEGGALGIGGGGGGGLGGLMTGRGAANVLTRTTAVLALLFFATSITLSLIGRSGGGSVLDSIQIDGAAPSAVDQPLLLGDERAAPPAEETPAAPAAPAEPTVPLSQ